MAIDIDDKLGDLLVNLSLALGVPFLSFFTFILWYCFHRPSSARLTNNTEHELICSIRASDWLTWFRPVRLHQSVKLEGCQYKMGPVVDWCLTRFNTVIAVTMALNFNCYSKGRSFIMIVVRKNFDHQTKRFFEMNITRKDALHFVFNKTEIFCGETPMGVWSEKPVDGVPTSTEPRAGEANGISEEAADALQNAITGGPPPTLTPSFEEVRICGTTIQILPDSRTGGTSTVE